MNYYYYTLVSLTVYRGDDGGGTRIIIVITLRIRVPMNACRRLFFGISRTKKI